MDGHDVTTRLLARILGQVYRLQDRVDGMTSGVGPAHIYGLLAGIDAAIDRELADVEGVSNAKLDAMADVLEPILQEPEKLEAFKGYYDIEPELEARGITRTEAMQILRYMWADHKFTTVIAKMDSSHSPAECRTFDLGDFEK